MIKILDYVRPKTLEEAYRYLNEIDGAEVLGGTTYVRLSSRTIKLAVDLQDVGIGGIERDGDYISIGAMAKLANVQFHDLIMDYAGGYLSDAISHIWSVQLRNVATVGGTIVPKWGFSDFITAVLALPAEVEFYVSGRMKLEDFLSNPTPKKDIMTRLLIKDEPRKASFKFMRNSHYDFSVINVAVSAKIVDGELSDWRIAVGARPAVATLATRVMDYLNSGGEDLERVASLVKEEIRVASDFRASEEYRRELMGVLVKRAVEEVIG